MGKVYRIRSPLRWGMLGAMLLLLACNLFSTSAPPPPPHNGGLANGGPAPQNSQPQGQPPQGPPPQGQPPAGGLQISFTADRTQINPGECATLQWQVSGPHFATLLNGEPVGDSGSKQVCPPESQAFFLQVDTGERMEERSVEIQVGGALPPAGAPPTGAPPTPAGSPPTAAPPPPPAGPPPTATPPPTPTSGVIIAPPPTVSISLPDLVLEDIWLGGPSSNDIVVSVRNEGAAGIVNASLSVMCSWERRDVMPPATALPITSVKTESHFNLGVGQSANILLSSGGTFSSTTEAGAYHVKCTVIPDILESDTTNNEQEANLP